MVTGAVAKAFGIAVLTAGVATLGIAVVNPLIGGGGAPDATAAQTRTAGNSTAGNSTAGNSTAGNSTAANGTAPADAVGGLVSRRARAVMSGDQTAWDGVLDAMVPGLLAAQDTMFSQLRLLPFTAFWYEVLPGAMPVTSIPGGATGTVRVRLHYRLPGDTRDVLQDQTVEVSHRDGVWLLAGVDPGTLTPALWDVGPLTVIQGQRVLVIAVSAAPTAASFLRRLAGEADDAAARVERVWGTPGPRPAVVVMPQTRQQMARLLGSADDAGLGQLAAVTSGEISRDASGTPQGTADRVVLNPDPFARLTATGRQVVLAHELTHVTTRAVARLSMPAWVEEGFADYVAYRDTGLKAPAIAAESLRLVRAGTAADDLPAQKIFDRGGSSLAAAYADAWLAFSLMNDTGPERPALFFRTAAGLEDVSVAGSGALDLAFRQVLGTTETEFVARWREYRSRLAAQEGRS